MSNLLKPGTLYIFDHMNEVAGFGIHCEDDSGKLLNQIKKDDLVLIISCIENSDNPYPNTYPYKYTTRLINGDFVGNLHCGDFLLSRFTEVQEDELELDEF